MLFGKKQILLGSLERRQLVPQRHFDVARRHTVMPVPQQLQLQILTRRVSRMECRKPLGTVITSEQHHAREHGLLRTHRLQRTLPHHEIVLGNAGPQKPHGNHDDSLQHAPRSKLDLTKL